MTLSNGKTYSIHFYDTAGQERYRSVALNIIKTCHGIILMYDITDQSSFDAIPEWIKDIRDNQKPDYPIILLGNKCDLEGKRIISKEAGEELAKKYKLSFFETSNKDGTNLKSAKRRSRTSKRFSIAWDTVSSCSSFRSMAFLVYFMGLFYHFLPALPTVA